MATRSAIAVQDGNKFKGIYCHWDGYVSNNGRILQEYYNRTKALELIALGDLSSLRPSIGEKHPFSSHESKDVKLTYEQYEAAYGDMCTFYGRDREEVDTAYKTFDTLEAFIEHYEGCGCEYFYYMDEAGAWHVNAYNKGWEPLTECVRRHLEEA